MIEPRAIVGRNGDTFKLHRNLPEGTPLTTVADVLAALRGTANAYPVESGETRRTFLAMLDQFERDQGSAT